MVLSAVHILTWGFAFGAPAFYSLVASPRAFKQLPRREFGALQAETLPLQFAMQTVAPLVIGLTAPYTIGSLGLGVLAASALGGAVNMAYLHPKCAEIKVQRWAVIDGEFGGDEAAAKASGKLAQLDSRFGKLHMVSMVANLASILAIGGYAFVMGARMGPRL